MACRLNNGGILVFVDSQSFVRQYCRGRECLYSWEAERGSVARAIRCSSIGVMQTNFENLIHEVIVHGMTELPAI